MANPITSPDICSHDSTSSCRAAGFCRLHSLPYCHKNINFLFRRRSSQMTRWRLFIVVFVIFLREEEKCQTRRCTTVSPPMNCVPEQTWFCPPLFELQETGTIFSSGMWQELSWIFFFLALKYTKKDMKDWLFGYSAVCVTFFLCSHMHSHLIFYDSSIFTYSMSVMYSDRGEVCYMENMWLLTVSFYAQANPNDLKVTLNSLFHSTVMIWCFLLHVLYYLMFNFILLFCHITYFPLKMPHFAWSIQHTPSLLSFVTSVSLDSFFYLTWNCPPHQLMTSIFTCWRLFRLQVLLSVRCGIITQ